MPLITTVNTFKKYVRVVYTSTDANGLPNMERADRKWLIPVLGSDVYAALLAQLSGTVTWITLLDICRCYVAPMAMLSELPTRNIAITDSGLKKTTSQDMDNVFKWEYLELKNSLEEHAAEALDELWQHLLSDGSDYTWINTSTGSEIITTAAEFKKYYPNLKHIYRIFPSLQPLMAEVEDQFISPAIGADQLSALLALPSPDADETAALLLIKKALANFTIMAATQKLSCALTDKGFTLLLSSNADAANAGELAAGGDQLSALRDGCEKTATNYLQALKELLNETASRVKFAEYFASALYTAPGTTITSRNATRTGVFGL